MILASFSSYFLPAACSSPLAPLCPRARPAAARQHGNVTDGGYGPTLHVRPDPTMDLSLADLVRAA
jgi:hypothetical protein